MCLASLLFAPHGPHLLCFQASRWYLLRLTLRSRVLSDAYRVLVRRPSPWSSSQPRKPHSSGTTSAIITLKSTARMVF
ncbi:hypothetical protein KC349_g233 [Hortaea werneckii]|nr:hypothetical protein KC349_g233 [Hortaea werneckii]